jgi:hypothetical protein
MSELCPRCDTDLVFAVATSFATDDALAAVVSSAGGDAAGVVAVAHELRGRGVRTAAMPGAPASPCRAGAALHELLAGPPFFFASGGDCGCESFAAQMDAWGCDEVIRRIDQVVAHLEQQAARRGLPFHRVAGRILVRRAVRNARRAEQRERHDG